MVKQYLLNYQQELLSQKIDIENSIQKIKIALKENMELIHFIEKSEDRSYDSFFPLQYKNTANENKLKELKEKQKELENQEKDIEEKLYLINDKLIDLDEVITFIKNEEKPIEEYAIEESFTDYNNKQNFININVDDSYTNISKENIKNIIHKIELCNKLIDIDNNRCKLELNSIANLLKNIIQ